MDDRYILQCNQVDKQVQKKYEKDEKSVKGQVQAPSIDQFSFSPYSEQTTAPGNIFQVGDTQHCNKSYEQDIEHLLHSSLSTEYIQDVSFQNTKEGQLPIEPIEGSQDIKCSKPFVENINNLDIESLLYNSLDEQNITNDFFQNSYDDSILNENEGNIYAQQLKSQDLQSERKLSERSIKAQVNCCSTQNPLLQKRLVDITNNKLGDELDHDQNLANQAQTKMLDTFPTATKLGNKKQQINETLHINSNKVCMQGRGRKRITQAQKVQKLQQSSKRTTQNFEGQRQYNVEQRSVQLKNQEQIERNPLRITKHQQVNKEVNKKKLRPQVQKLRSYTSNGYQTTKGQELLDQHLINSYGYQTYDSRTTQQIEILNTDTFNKQEQARQQGDSVNPYSIEKFIQPDTLNQIQHVPYQNDGLYSHTDHKRRMLTQSTRRQGLMDIHSNIQNGPSLQDHSMNQRYNQSMHRPHNNFGSLRGLQRTDSSYIDLCCQEDLRSLPYGTQKIPLGSITNNMDPRQGQFNYMEIGDCHYVDRDFKPYSSVPQGGVLNEYRGTRQAYVYPYPTAIESKNFQRIRTLQDVPKTRLHQQTQGLEISMGVNIPKYDYYTTFNNQKQVDERDLLEKGDDEDHIQRIKKNQKQYQLMCNAGTSRNKQLYKIQNGTGRHMQWITQTHKPDPNFQRDLYTHSQSLPQFTNRVCTYRQPLINASQCNQNFLNEDQRKIRFTSVQQYPGQPISLKGQLQQSLNNSGKTCPEFITQGRISQENKLNYTPYQGFGIISNYKESNTFRDGQPYRQSYIRKEVLYKPMASKDVQNKYCPPKQDLGQSNDIRALQMLGDLKQQIKENTQKNEVTKLLAMLEITKKIYVNPYTLITSQIAEAVNPILYHQDVKIKQLAKTIMDQWSLIMAQHSNQNNQILSSQASDMEKGVYEQQQFKRQKMSKQEMPTYSSQQQHFRN